MKKSICFYGVICLCALCARMAQTKGRERTTKKNRTPKRKKKRTPRTPPKSYKKCHFGSQNGSQNRSRDPLFRSWRPVSRKIDPKTRPRTLLGDSGNEKKRLDAPKSAPRKFPSHFCPPSKHTPPPRGRRFPSRESVGRVGKVRPTRESGKLLASRES